MKLTTSKEALATALQSSVCNNAHTIAILSHVKLTADEGGLTITSTDLSTTVSTKVEADVAGVGETMVSNGRLSEIVKRLPKGASVSLSKDDRGNLVIKSGRSRFLLPVLPSEDFPSPPVDEAAATFSVPVADFSRLLSKVAFAAAGDDDFRYHLRSVYLTAAHAADKELLRAVATNGHRLACADMALPSGAEWLLGRGVIIERNIVERIIKLCGSGNVSVGVNDKRISITSGTTLMVAKLIDATYPDYQRVIPSGEASTLLAHTETMGQALLRVLAVADPKSTRGLKLSCEGGVVTASVSDSNTGSADEEIEASWDGGPISIGFTGYYLTDILKAVDADEVSIALTDAGSPALIRGRGDDATKFVLMPRRI